MYTTLGVATVFETKQLVGYLRPLQCWIYEHFLCICDKMVQHCPMGSPRAKRWKVNIHISMVLLSIGGGSMH
ncbi:unnamed protein product [Lathyrus oleraceus]